MKKILLIIAFISLFTNQSNAQMNIQNVNWKYCTSKYDCDIQSPQGDLSNQEKPH